MNADNTQKPVNIERDWLRHHVESWYSELLVYSMKQVMTDHVILCECSYRWLDTSFE